jgi:hypothetical protein
MKVRLNLGSLVLTGLICLPAAAAIVSEANDSDNVGAEVGGRGRAQGESDATRQEFIRTFSPTPELIVGAMLELGAWDSGACCGEDGFGLSPLIDDEGGVNPALYGSANGTDAETVTFSPRGGVVRVVEDPKLNVIAVLSAFLLVGSGLLILIRRKRKRARKAGARAGSSKRY